jgi:hypothetical protein
MLYCLVVPNPILPNNKTAALSPSVYAGDIQDHINAFVARPVTPGGTSAVAPSLPTESRPTTPLKPCLKTHARAHSAARKRRVRVSEKDNTTHEHSSSMKNPGPKTPGPKTISHKATVANEWAATEAPRVVQHTDSGGQSSMFGMSMGNPDYEPDTAKQSHHYTPFSAPSQKIADTIQLKLDNRMISLHEAFQYLDTTNCGYITHEELLNACWYWGIRLEQKDFIQLAEEHFGVSDHDSCYRYHLIGLLVNLYLCLSVQVIMRDFYLLYYILLIFIFRRVLEA